MSVGAYSCLITGREPILTARWAEPHKIGGLHTGDGRENAREELLLTYLMSRWSLVSLKMLIERSKLAFLKCKVAH